MPSEESVRQLIEARGRYLKDASERRDFEELASWMSEDIVYENAALGTTIIGVEAVKAVYRDYYEKMPKFKIIKSSAIGTTPEFVACEFTCECGIKEDMPTSKMELSGGQTFRMRAASFMWWKWEGKGDKWDGTLAEDQVRGWKLAREHLYAITVPGDIKRDDIEKSV